MMKFLRGLFLITLFTSCTGEIDEDPNSEAGFTLQGNGKTFEFNEKPTPKQHHKDHHK